MLTHQSHAIVKERSNMFAPPSPGSEQLASAQGELPSERALPHLLPPVLGTGDLIALFLFNVFWVTNITPIAIGGVSGFLYWGICGLTFFIPCSFVMAHLARMYPASGGIVTSAPVAASDGSLRSDWFGVMPGVHCIHHDELIHSGPHAEWNLVVCHWRNRSELPPGIRGPQCALPQRGPMGGVTGRGSRCPAALDFPRKDRVW
jgi:hypothetical protein